MTVRAAAADATRKRIVEAAVEAFSTRWFEDVTVRDVARDAGVALQTVRNHFGSKEDLFLAATEAFSADIDLARSEAVPGDIRGAVVTLVDDYEGSGDAILRLLASEGRVPAVQAVLARGRASHQAWVERVFTTALSGLKGKRRARRIAQLVVATDVYTWKLLRRDKRLDRDQTIIAMCELVNALHDNAGGGTK
jgi:AcrR family transcriptional regulator